MLTSIVDQNKKIFIHTLPRIASNFLQTVPVNYPDWTHHYHKISNESLSTKKPKKNNDTHYAIVRDPVERFSSFFRSFVYTPEFNNLQNLKIYLDKVLEGCHYNNHINFQKCVWKYCTHEFYSELKYIDMEDLPLFFNSKRKWTPHAAFQFEDTDINNFFYNQIEKIYKDDIDWYKSLVKWYR